MTMFRNLIIFRLTDGWKYSTDELESALSTHEFIGCGATDRSAAGWIQPCSDGRKVYAVNGQHLISLGIEEKLLPAGIVRQYAVRKLAEIESAQGFKPGRKQSNEVREQVELELLPSALKKRSQILVWIDPIGRTLSIETSSQAKADLVIEHLKQALGELPLTLIKTRLAPGSAMTQWLSVGEAPAGLTIDRDGVLEASAEERAAVKYVRHNLDTDEIRNHIASGKSVRQLALTWADKVSFILTEQMQIKRIALLDILKEDAERQAETADDLFAANLTIYAGELAQLIQSVIKACGGETNESNGE